MNWKFWKHYTISRTAKIGPAEISYTVTAPSLKEAKKLIEDLESIHS